MWLKLRNVPSAPTDLLVEWLRDHAAPHQGSYLKARRYEREMLGTVRAELERRAAVHPLAGEIEAVAIRDERTGAFDIWKMFQDSELFDRVVQALADPFSGERVTKVIGIEARGYPLASGVALRLRAGFVPIRKGAGFLPGPTIACMTAPDYGGKESELQLQLNALRRTDRVLR